MNTLLPRFSPHVPDASGSRRRHVYSDLWRTRGIRAAVLWVLAFPACVFSQETDVFHPIRFLVGEWIGEGENSVVTHSYASVLQNKFIRSSSLSIPRDGDDEVLGPIHEDEGFFSYDPERRIIVFRQFLSEGFVNVYLLETRDVPSDSLVFISERCEGAGEMRARLIIHRLGSDRYDMILELASPGRPLTPCQVLSMTRVTE